MPTRGRQTWAWLSLQCFLDQDYSDKELVILDDEDDPSFPLGAEFDCVRYFREPQRNIIDKRNRVNELASGDLIAHFDSDDYSAPNRLTEQVAFMQFEQVSLVGFSSLLFYEPSTQKVAKYVGPRDYACGTSMLYKKSLWEAHPFRVPKPVPGADNPLAGSDNGFVREVRAMKQISATDAGNLMVARAHEGNMSPKRMYKFNKQLTLADLPKGFPR